MAEIALRTDPLKLKKRRGRQKKQASVATPELLRTRLWLRVKEYSDLTGTPLPTVYALIKTKKIEGVIKIGDSIRIPASAVKAA
jgi:excisionase family DNA binding protein